MRTLLRFDKGSVANENFLNFSVAPNPAATANLCFVSTFPIYSYGCDAAGIVGIVDAELPFGSSEWCSTVPVDKVGMGIREQSGAVAITTRSYT